MQLRNMCKHEMVSLNLRLRKHSLQPQDCVA